MAESGVQNDLLNIARKAADRIVADFLKDLVIHRDIRN